LDFIVDEMLKGLVRWLRILGFNTLKFENLSKGRFDLLSDYYYLTGSPIHYDLWTYSKKILLKENRVDSQLHILNSELNIFRQIKPFSRCSVCNNPLKKAVKENLLDRIPPAVAKNMDHFYECFQCSKIYWAGGHVLRILDKMQRMGIPIEDKFKGGTDDEDK
jgi:uncharacterized protein with PIN domain